MCEISIVAFLASTLESPRNSLHLNSHHYFDKWTNSKSESKSSGSASECVLEFQEEGESNILQVAFHTVIVTIALLERLYLKLYMAESTKLILLEWLI